MGGFSQCDERTRRRLLAAGVVEYAVRDSVAVPPSGRRRADASASLRRLGAPSARGAVTRRSVTGVLGLAARCRQRLMPRDPKHADASSRRSYGFSSDASPSPDSPISWCHGTPEDSLVLQLRHWWWCCVRTIAGWRDGGRRQWMSGKRSRRSRQTSAISRSVRSSSIAHSGATGDGEIADLSQGQRAVRRLAASSLEGDALRDAAHACGRGRLRASSEAE